MFKRFVFVLLLVPSVALAEGEQLGPSTTADPNQGPSRDASQLLQPASPTTSQSLQSADAIEGGIPQASTNNNLQTAGNQQQYNEFVGPQGGEGQNELATEPERDRPWWIPGIVIGIAMLFWIQEQFQPLRRR